MYGWWPSSNFVHKLYFILIVVVFLEELPFYLKLHLKLLSYSIPIFLSDPSCILFIFQMSFTVPMSIQSDFPIFYGLGPYCLSLFSKIRTILWTIPTLEKYSNCLTLSKVNILFIFNVYLRKVTSYISLRP